MLIHTPELGSIRRFIADRSLVLNKPPASARAAGDAVMKVPSVAAYTRLKWRKLKLKAEIETRFSSASFKQ
jgi:hypothetical protein